MSYLQFPFKGRCFVRISTGKKMQTVECELATSVIEIFQSLSFRQPGEFQMPLVLKFADPDSQSFVLSRYNFLIEQIPIDKNGKVSGYSIVPAGTSPGNYIQAFSSFQYLIQASLGFAKKYHINENTLINIH